ncbi:hypothetical protein V8F33_009354 [Rhypophila sp. PSN 637]
MTKREFRWSPDLLPDSIITPPYSYGAKNSEYMDEDVFMMDDIAQAMPTDLRNLFSGKSKEKEPLKKWYTTQLHFYGVTSKKTASRSELRPALKSAHDAGKYDDAVQRVEDEQFANLKGNMAMELHCDPPRFIAKYFLDARGCPDQKKTKKALSLEKWYDPDGTKELSEYLIGWDHTIKKGIEDEFNRIEATLPSNANKSRRQAEQANISIELFLARNLGLCPDGQSAAGRRTSEPVVLHPVDLSDENKEIINNLAGRAPGLVMKKHHNYHIIGWDAVKVNAEIDRFKADDKRSEDETKARKKSQEEEEVAEKKARWEKRSELHRRLVANLERNPSRPVFGLQLLIGKYLVRYEHEGDGLYAEFYDHMNGHSEMTLNIFPAGEDCRGHGLVASFDFGNTEGTMLLGISREKVVLLRKGLLKDYRKYDRIFDDSDDSDNDGNLAWSNNPSFGFGPSQSSNFTSRGQQLASSSSTTTGSATVAGTKRPAPDTTSVADPFGVLAARAKRQRMLEEEAKAKANTHTGAKQEPKIKQEHNESGSLAAIPPAPTTTRIKKEQPEDSSNTLSFAPQQQNRQKGKPISRRIHFQFAYEVKDKCWPSIDDERTNRVFGI